MATLVYVIALFLTIEPRVTEIVLPKEEKNLAKKIDLSLQQTEHYMQVLNNVMETEKAYLDQDLSLDKLAQRTRIPARQLSQFIQSSFQKNYKEYVSSYRVNHAQALLTHQNKRKHTMYSIAFDSGFNSESSFYKIFKDQTGVTPKQYQDSFKEVLV